MPRTRTRTVTRTDSDVLLGEVKGRLDSLEEKIEHNCQTNKDNMKNLSEKMESLETTVMGWIEKHQTYHLANEEVWGIPTWLKRHRIATVLLVMAGITIAAAYGITVEKLLTALKTTMEVVNGITPK